MSDPRKARPNHGLPIRAGDYCVLALDALLLAVFTLQAIVAGCLLIYGSIPVPTAWAAALFQKTEAEGLHLEVEELRLDLGGSLRVIRPRLLMEEETLPFLEAESAIFQFRFSHWPREFLPRLDSLVLSGGTVHLPAFYSPSGQRLEVLERAAFKLSLRDERVQIESFAARHRTMRVRGALDWPVRLGKTDGKAPLPETLRRAFHLLGQGVRQADRISPFETPTLFFNLSESAGRELNGRIHLSSRKLRHERVQAENIRLETSMRFADGKLITKEPIRLTARHLSFPEYKVDIESPSAEIAVENWSRIAGAEGLAIELAADSLRRGEFALKAPVLKVDPGDLRALRFSGSAEGLKGAFSYSGEADPAAGSGHIEANGMLDPRELLRGAAAERLHRIEWIEPPYTRVEARLSEGFSLEEARFSLQFGSTIAEGIRFDSIHAGGRYDGKVLDLDRAQLTRGKQWLDASLRYDIARRDYSLTLLGSAIPYDYNAILPRWWATIFSDIRFDGPNSAYGDFIIHGTAGSRFVRLFYGSAEGGAISYREVPIEKGHLKVRGRGRYVELFDLDATTGGGSLKGNFSWTSRPDGIRAPVSTRFDIESHIPLESLRKLAPGPAGSIIDNFSPENPPDVFLEGVYFHREYPEFDGLSAFRLTADSKGPVRVRGIPLERLAFRLEGRKSHSHLRDLNFGYAGGTGGGIADIFNGPDSPSTIRFKVQLEDADRHEALDGLSALRANADAGERLETRKPERTGEPPTSLDFELHAEGPADDLYAYRGLGRFHVEDPSLGALQLLGPLSRILQNTPLGFTTFNLHTAAGRLELAGEQLLLPDLRIEGERTRITAKGTFGISEKTLDMRVLVQLFGNIGEPGGAFQQIGRVFSPLANFLSFQLTGTVEKPQWRSVYDPRNFIPGLR